MHFVIKTFSDLNSLIDESQTIFVQKQEPPYVTMRASGTEVDEVIYSFSPA